MKKLRILTAIVLLVCLSIVAVPNVFASESLNPPYPGFTGYCYTTGTPTTALREGPGTTYKILSNVAPLADFYVISVSNGWAKVTDRKGDPADGYICTTFLCIDPNLN